MTTTTYTKLRDGSWGIRGIGLRTGQSIIVTKRDGTSKTESVGKVLWTGPDGASIATINGHAHAAHARACVECGVADRYVSRCQRCGAPLHSRCSDSITGTYCQACAE